MLSFFYFRVMAGVLLLIFVTLVIIFLGTKKENISFQTKSKIEVPGILQTIWPLLNSIFPLLSLLIVTIKPDILYGTWLNISFHGDSIVQLGSLILFIGGCALLALSNHHLGRFMVIEIAVSRDHKLINTGPYSRIRHPTYTGIILLNFATFMFFLNILFAINFIIVFSIANYRAELEERLLSSEDGFGEKYKTYMKHTGRFIPKF